MKEPVIDRAAFLELQQTAGPEFVSELAVTFFEEAPGLLAELRQSFAARDSERFRRAAHSLKSNASTFGALQLTALARECELGGLGSPDRVLSQLEGVERAYERAARELGELCRERG